MRRNIVIGGRPIAKTVIGQLRQKTLKIRTGLYLPRCADLAKDLESQVINNHKPQKYCRSIYSSFED